MKEIPVNVYSTLKNVSTSQIPCFAPDDMKPVKKSCKTWDSGTTVGNCLFGTIALCLLKFYGADLKQPI